MLMAPALASTAISMKERAARMLGESEFYEALTKVLGFSGAQPGIGQLSEDGSGAGRP